MCLLKIIFVWCVRDVEVAEAIFQDYFIPLFQHYCKKSESGSFCHVDHKDRVFLTLPQTASAQRELKIEFHFHLSKKDAVDKSKLSDASVWKFGRVDLGAIFTEIDEMATEPKRAGVAVCGPSTMIADARRQCIDHSKRRGIQYDLHEELFFF